MVQSSVAPKELVALVASFELVEIAELAQTFFLRFDDECRSRLRRSNIASSATHENGPTNFLEKAESCYR